MHAKQDRKPLRNLYTYHRQAWSYRAAYHLARVRLGDDRALRLASAVWLMENRVPLDGRAPTMRHKGV